jgi:hypothetical protein
MELERRVPRWRIGNRREQCHERGDDLQGGRQVGCRKRTISEPIGA